MKRYLTMIFLIQILFSVILTGKAKSVYIAYDKGGDIVLTNIKGEIKQKIKLPVKEKGGFKIIGERVCFIGEDGAVYWYNWKEKKVEDRIEGPFWDLDKNYFKIFKTDIEWEKRGKEKITLYDCKKLKDKVFYLIKVFPEQARYREKKGKNWGEWTPWIYGERFYEFYFIRKNKIRIVFLGEYTGDAKIVDENRILYIDDEGFWYHLVSKSTRQRAIKDSEEFSKQDMENFNKIDNNYVSIISVDSDKIYLGQVLKYKKGKYGFELFVVKKSKSAKEQWIRKRIRFYKGEKTERWWKRKLKDEYNNRYILFMEGENREKKIGIFDMKENREWYIGRSETTARFYIK